MTTAIYLGCKNSKDISYTLESKIKAAITYSILSVEKVLKAKQPQIIGFEFEINDNLEPFVKQISIVDNPKLIKAIKDKQVCNLPENNKCEVILDTLQNINFIQSHQFQIRKWNVPKMNQVKYHQLIDEFGQPLSNIKTFHSNRLQSFNVVSKHLKRRGLKNTQIKNNSSFKHGLVYTSTIEFDNKKKYTNQLTYSINAVWPSFLSDKFKLIKSLKEFDKLQPYNNVYNSSFINPLQYQIDFRNLSQPLSKDETEVLNLENKGMWILKSAQGMKGIGIELIYDLKDIQEAIKLKRDHHQLTDKLNIKNHKSFHRYFTLQKYIENPLLQDGKKFDSRQFILIVSSDPLIVVYQTGYTRKTLVDYHRFSKSKYTHLGNGDIQKELPGYKQKVQKNHNYLREEFKAKLIKEYPEYNQGSFELMEEKTKAGITYAIKAALNQNPNVRKGDTEIISVDMVIDENLNAFITEFNRNPYLGTSQSVLAQFFPSLGEDFADATLALHAMEHDEIIARSRENPFFICDIMKKIYNCKDNVLINDAVGYSYLDHVDIQSYKYPEYKIYEEKDREQYQKDRKQRKRKILK